MRERPILFSGPMVRAILAGQKTQTRRAVKPQPCAGVRSSPFCASGLEDGHGREIRLRYGRPGDRLWVREATIRVEDHGYEGPVYVESDDGRACLDGGLSPDPDDCVEVEPWELRIRPSIHMPRSHSRITLEITGTRVERLQDIREADALAEGIERPEDIQNVDVWDGAERALFNGLNQPQSQYRRLWDSINGAGAWDANPWVWVVQFRRIEA